LPPPAQINPHHAARPDLLEVTAYSPTRRPLGCPVSEDNGTFYASFQPDEGGCNFEFSYKKYHETF
jgi:hypothetical protein